MEQSIKDASYIHQLNLYLFERGYCSSEIPKLVKKSKFYNPASGPCPLVNYGEGKQVTALRAQEDSEYFR